MLSNPSYYYGSLVRVLVNEKGEATHVLELGNPAQLAIGTNDNDVVHFYNENSRWADVADWTAETANGRNVTNIDGDIVGISAVMAKINYNASGDAKELTFQSGSFTPGVVNQHGQLGQSVQNWKLQNAGAKVDLKLTAKTKYFVADVNTNQLTQVKDVDEALRILGNTAASNWFSDVYAGYNVVDGAEKHETAHPTAIQGYKEATVVVFNHVQKDNNNEMTLRVKNDSTGKYDITFEDVDGNEVMKNVIEYRGGFPHNYNADKLDVDKLTFNNARGIGIERLIDHSDVKAYPIVKVIRKDDEQLVVADKYGSTARLIVGSEADIFLNGQLKEGAFIQFRTETNNAAGNDATTSNTVEIVSVMPKGIEFDGVLQNSVLDNQDNVRFAKGIEVKDITRYLNKDVDKVMVRELRDFYNVDDGYRSTYVIVNQTESNKLKDWINANGPADIRYEVQKQYGDVVEVSNLHVYRTNADGTHEWVRLVDAI